MSETRLAARGTPLHYLAEGSAELHLSVEAPERVPGWDVVVLTAASPRQAHIYEIQLESARKRGLLGTATRAIVAADPDGRRIGSGGATLNALKRVAETVTPEEAMKLKILLIHAGGDSKRVPWANLFGKCFIPFPLFADPDRQVPSLFDHQLAVISPLARRMSGGGMVSLAGDVIPLFSPSRVNLPENGGTVVTTPVSLDVAQHHGVIKADRRGRVVNLLQKASADTLARENALVGGGAALLDTGIYAFTGETCQSLIRLATSSPDPVGELVDSGASCSLYEEIASSFLTSRHGWLMDRPLGNRFIRTLKHHTLVNHVAEELSFIHFGTNAEVLEHLSGIWSGRLSRRILCECGGIIGRTSVICTSELHPAVPAGEQNMIYDCRLGSGFSVGNRCITIGVDSGEELFHVPDNTCIWQVPWRSDDSGETFVVTACCGSDDNPKDDSISATFCGRSLAAWLAEHKVKPEALWDKGQTRDLWHASLFPCVRREAGLRLTRWMLESAVDPDLRKEWNRTPRVSLSALHNSADIDSFLRRRREIRDRLVLTTVKRTAELGLERNIDALVSQVTPRKTEVQKIAEICREISELRRPGAHRVSRSRLLQMQSDLTRSAGDPEKADALSAAAFDAVQKEVNSFVRASRPEPVSGIPAGQKAEARLPVRFDIAGGWSDTPPYCLERPARVLNFSMSLNGIKPVAASVEALEEPRWDFTLEDDGLQLTVRDGEQLSSGGNPDDRFALLRAALILAGYGSETSIRQGAAVRTSSSVPRGSGLGTSSILGAALMTALQRLAGRDTGIHAVSELVLMLEQRMTTGGGWQDQIGGLAPGVKCISSVPARPIRLEIEPVPLLPEIREELQKRFVVAFTGIERLAKNVLQIVVQSYLRRETRALDSIARLVKLADEGRTAFALGDFDRLGGIMAEAWHVHQELDPHCSNAEVDAVFHKIEDLSSGAKLAGAGGGGFMGILARDPGAARKIRRILSNMGHGVRVYDWEIAD
ncbi:MAG: L-fucokinase [Kiritimatiellia bacterium]